MPRKGLEAVVKTLREGRETRSRWKVETGRKSTSCEGKELVSAGREEAVAPARARERSWRREVYLCIRLYLVCAIHYMSVIASVPCGYRDGGFQRVGGRGAALAALEGTRVFETLEKPYTTRMACILFARATRRDAAAQRCERQPDGWVDVGAPGVWVRSSGLRAMTLLQISLNL